MPGFLLQARACSIDACNRSDTAVDWKSTDRAAIGDLFHRRFAEFFTTTAKPDLTADNAKAKPKPVREESE